MRLQHLRLCPFFFSRVSGKRQRFFKRHNATRTDSVFRACDKDNVRFTSAVSPARLHIGLHTSSSQRLICSTPVALPQWIPLSIYRRIDEITYLYVEAKELLDFAQRHYDTIYFQQDLCRAQEAVTTTLKAFEAFLDSLRDEQRCYVQNSLGKRMDELVAFEQNLKDLSV